MPRRGRIVGRKSEPDAVFHDSRVSKFINKMMSAGKKSTVEHIFYQACETVKAKLKKEPLEVFLGALERATPLMMVKPRRVGGATYQVPIEVEPQRGMKFAMRWLVQAARERPGKSMAEKLAGEILDAFQGTGGAIRKKEEAHRVAEGNKAFAHFRW